MASFSQYSQQFGGMAPFGGYNLAQLFAQLTKGSQSANAANEARYAQVLAARQAEKDKLLGDIQAQGTGQRADINQDYEDLLNSSLANLASRGLASSSLDTTTRTGVERKRQRAIGNLEDQLLGRRIDLERDINEGTYGFQERRTDEGPDMGAILPLLSQLGSASGYNFSGQQAPMGPNTFLEASRARSDAARASLRKSQAANRVQVQARNAPRMPRLNPFATYTGPQFNNVNRRTF